MSGSTKYPLTVPVTLLRFQGSAVDEYGDPYPGYAAPETVLAFAVVVGGEEPVTAMRPERVRYDLTVFAPSSAGISDRDRIEYGGHAFDVEGMPGNWDANPWWSPGLVSVRCNRVEG